MRNRILNFIEALAYPIAAWNLFLLFFEPIVETFFYLDQVQKWTAWGNLFFIALALLLRLMLMVFREHRFKTIADFLILLFGSILFVYDAKFVIFFLFIRQVFYIARYYFFDAFNGALYKKMLSNPPVTFMASFAVTILGGTLLLMLPSASVAHKVTSFVNALFTATSATCVTGLVVLDTGSYFSLFGQLVILLLIQVGGLGIMTISTAFAVLLGQKLALRVENVMLNVMGESKSFDFITLIKNVVLFTAVIELAGAALLFFTFRELYSPGRAVYYSVFHSISAFCNAGFGLYSDSFARFAFSFHINAIITTLIILGGLGFPVIVDLFNHVTRRSSQYSITLHSKVVLSMTGLLLLGGTLFFFISEYSHTMRDMALHHKALCSWFQSVTCRTAGFNTVNQGQLSHSSVLVSVILMFIGASPGSTGGGVKTSTFAILILSIIALIKGQTDLTLFKRRILPSSVRQSTSLITLSLAFVCLIVFLILMLDPFSLETTLFEAVSAFGTVGLSMGITPDLSSVSKILIVILMYIGRVGPLTVLFALSQRTVTPSYVLPEERIAIG